MPLLVNVPDDLELGRDHGSHRCEVVLDGMVVHLPGYCNVVGLVFRSHRAGVTLTRATERAPHFTTHITGEATTPQSSAR
jgi:hypothetical protein